MDLEAVGRSFQDSEGRLGAGLANALSRNCERQAWHADVASQRLANAFQCSAGGTQSQQHILIIRTSFELGSDACKLETPPAAQA